MKDLKNIEDLFKETFDNFESTPPASVKAAVDGAIKKKKRGLWWLPVLALLLATLPLTYYFTSDPDIAKEKNVRSISESNSSHQNESSGTFVSFENSKQQAIQNENSNLTPNEKILRHTQAGSTQVAQYPKIKTQNDKVVTTKSGTTTSKDLKSSSKTTKKSKKVPASKQKQKTPVASRTPQNTDALVTSSSVQSDQSSSEVNATENTSTDSTPVPDGNLADVKTQNDSLTELSENEKLNDSTELSATPELPVNKSKDNPRKWSASIYAGPQFDFAFSKNKESELNVNPALRYSLEVNQIFANDFGASTGLGYFKTNDNYSRFTYYTDSIADDVDTIPIYDQQNPDSIIGYDYVFHYNTDTLETKYRYSVSNFVIPIYVTKQFDFGNNWGMLINAGAIYRYSKIKNGADNPEGNEPMITQQSLMIAGRIHATYKLDNWMFSLGFNTGYYVKPPLKYQGIYPGRFYINPEIGVHFNF